MTNQLLAESDALPILDEYAGMSITDICLAAANWPEGSEDQLRAIAAIRARAPGIGHNRPPLAEALDDELAPRRARADQLLAATPVIIDEVSAAKVVDWTSQLKALHDEVDKARLARTEPYRNAWKLINNRYDVLKLRLAVGIDAGGKMLTVWRLPPRVCGPRSRPIAAGWPRKPANARRKPPLPAPPPRPKPAPAR